LRAEAYSGLIDYIIVNDDDQVDASKVGKRVILPSTFGAGPRSMHQKYQDSMAIVRQFGKPDYFITVTCNPNWPEIKDAMKDVEDLRIQDVRHKSSNYSIASPHARYAKSSVQC
jgi:hypothetical protein